MNKAISEEIKIADEDEIKKAISKENSQENATEAFAEMDPALSEKYPSVRHGELIRLGKTETSFEYIIQDPVGIHARPAGKLAEIARKFDCEVTIQAKEKSTSATSMIGLMNLGAAKGDTLRVTAEGREARSAIRALKTFMMQNL